MRDHKSGSGSDLAPVGWKGQEGSEGSRNLNPLYFKDSLGFFRSNQKNPKESLEIHWIFLLQQESGRILKDRVIRTDLNKRITQDPADSY